MRWESILKVFRDMSNLFQNLAASQQIVRRATMVDLAKWTEAEQTTEKMNITAWRIIVGVNVEGMESHSVCYGNVCACAACSSVEQRYFLLCNFYRVIEAMTISITR